MKNRAATVAGIACVIFGISLAVAWVLLVALYSITDDKQWAILAKVAFVAFWCFLVVVPFVFLGVTSEAMPSGVPAAGPR